MSGEALGGGVMVAFAATLWVAYLMPTWSRRRHYLATERNAVRLQQTLRIMAETAEVPEQVRLEASARTVLTQQKLLAQAEDDARADAKAATDAATAKRRAIAAMTAARRADDLSALTAPALAIRRLRKRRAGTSLALLTGLVSVIFGALVAALGGSWLLLAGGALVVVSALAVLGRLAREARTARIVRTVSDPPVESVRGQRFEPVQLEETPAARSTWTPRPLPKPLHLSQGTVAQAAMASVDAAAELRKAAAEAELSRCMTERAADVTPIAGAGTLAVSRFASMGIVGRTEPGMADLDAVLRRRRAG